MLRSMDQVSKWTATGVYIAIWGTFALATILFTGVWAVILLPIGLAWASFNVVQVWRGKRERLWG